MPFLPQCMGAHGVNDMLILCVVCQKYLDKYGYLNCRSASQTHEKDGTTAASQHRRNTGAPSHNKHPPPPPLPPPVIRPNCTDYDIKEALRTLQEAFQLSPTGRLDDATRSTMNKGRCGNSDNLRHLPLNGSTAAAAAAADANDQHKGRMRLKHRRTVFGGGKRKPKNGTKNGRVTRASVSHIEHAIVEDELGGGGSKSTAVSSNGHRQNYHRRRFARSVVFDPEEGLSGNPLRRRMHMLRDIASRIRTSAAASSPRRNSTRAERRLAQRLLTGGDRGSRARRRKRRSVHVAEPTTNQGSEAASEATSSHGLRIRLANDERKPVRWRLLESGISGKIPLAEQKAALELSFRMWSEIIPLKFFENERLDLSLMDIIIAFGRGTSLGYF